MSQIQNPEHKLVRVDELDGLRGLLSLWVAVSHIFCWAGFWEFFAKQRSFGLVFIGAGAAVDTFIILSGFSISFLLSKRRQPYGQFILGRFFRIYPVFLVCLVLGMAEVSLLTPFVLDTAQWRNTVYFEWHRDISFSESAAFGSHAFWHITLLNGLIPKNLLVNSTGTLLTPAWSISLEWQYYLLAPLLALAVRSGIGLLFLTAFAWVGLRYGYLWENPHLAFLPVQLPLFLIGIGSYHLYDRFAKSECQHSSAFAVPFAALITVSILTPWHSTALAAWALAFGCIFVRGNDLFSRALSIVRTVLLHPLLQRLGQISYPLYLVHWPLIIAFLAVLFYWRPGISSYHAVLLLLFIGLPFILLAASILHVFVERPLMTFGKRIAATRNC